MKRYMVTPLTPYTEGVLMYSICLCLGSVLVSEDSTGVKTEKKNDFERLKLKYTD